MQTYLFGIYVHDFPFANDRDQEITRTSASRACGAIAFFFVIARNGFRETFFFAAFGTALPRKFVRLPNTEFSELENRKQ